MYVVYALEDPRNATVFYVGQTADLYGRFIQHIKCIENNQEKNERIHELKALGLLPIPRTLETVHTVKLATERETYWIRHFAYLGMPLTNELRRSFMRSVRKEANDFNLAEMKLDIEPMSTEFSESIGERIIAMQAQKMQKPEIMKALWNVSPGAGKAYEQANEQYSEAMSAISNKLKETIFF